MSPSNMKITVIDKLLAVELDLSWVRMLIGQGDMFCLFRLYSHYPAAFEYPTSTNTKLYLLNYK